MLPPELSWVALVSLVARASCSNDFVTSKFPSEFSLDEKTEFYWKDLKGYIAGIRVHASGDDEDSDSNWILEPNCSDSDSDSDSDSSCTAYANNGSAYFGGSHAVYSNGTRAAVGSGYELRLLWTDSEDYDDIDDDTSEVSSPSFSIVRGTSGGGASGMGKGEKAGIAVAVVFVIVLLFVVLWWRLRKERRRRRRRKAEREAEEGHGHGDERWTPAANGLGKGEGTWTSWVSAALPEKPSPTAGKGQKSKSGGQPYLDNKAELPGDSYSQQHKPGLRGVTAAVGGKTKTRAVRLPVAPVELPTEPMREQDAAWRSMAPGTTFVYNSRPSYALRTPVSPGAEFGPVSPVSPGPPGPVDGSVSPVSPISRKPVGGSVDDPPVEQKRGGGNRVRIVVTDTTQGTRDDGRL